MSGPTWVFRVLVACNALPGSREAILGELVVGDEQSARQEALLWLAAAGAPLRLVGGE